MKRRWTEEELDKHWAIEAFEQPMVLAKHGTLRLGFALILKFFQIEGRFPASVEEIPRSAIAYLANQLGGGVQEAESYPWAGRSMERHRAEIRDWCGFREITVPDLEALKRWLVEDVIPQESRVEGVCEALLQRCRALQIEPAAADHRQRVILSALKDHDTRLCTRISQRLDAAAVERMDALLLPDPREGEPEWTPWQSLKGEPGKAGVASVKEAAVRLALLRGIKLPAERFKNVPFKLVERFAKQAGVEEPFELRRHGRPLKATLQAAFLHLRSEDLMDHLVDLLVETVHKMTKKADRRIEQSLGAALQKAPAKMVKLYRMAKASVAAPKGVVEEVIFPAVPETWLQALIQEVENDGVGKSKVKATLQRVYRSHYRQMLPGLLNSLDFHTITPNQTVLDALDLVKTHLDHKGTTYPKGVSVPLKGIVPADWMPHVVVGEGDSGKVVRTAAALQGHQPAETPPG